MNKAISTRLTFAVAILSLLIFIILWQVIAQQGLLVKNFPGSFKTIGSLIWWVSDPFFDNGPNDLGIGTNLLISLRRVLIGYSLAVLVAVPLGVLMGMSKLAQSSLNPYVQLLKPVSPLAWLPVGLFVFRNSEITGIFVIFITSIWPTLINTAFGVASINPDYLRVSKSLGASKSITIRRVICQQSCQTFLQG